MSEHGLEYHKRIYAPSMESLDGWGDASSGGSIQAAANRFYINSGSYANNYANLYYRGNTYECVDFDKNPIAVFTLQFGAGVAKMLTFYVLGCPGEKSAGFRVEDTKLYAETYKGAIKGESEITSINLSLNHVYKVVFTSTSCKFYVDGVLKATLTANLPSGKPVSEGACLLNFFCLTTEDHYKDLHLYNAWASQDW